MKTSTKLIVPSLAILSAIVALGASPALRPPATAPAATPAPAASQPALAPLPSPVAAGAELTKLADIVGDIRPFTEGATRDKDGNVYFIDQSNDRILKWTFDPNSPDPLKGSYSVFLHPSGYANGMSFDLDGNLLVCADEKNQLWQIQGPLPAAPPEGFKPSDLKITVLIEKLNDKLLNGPNDVWVVPTGPLKGGIYFTDPLFPRTWWGELRPKNDPNIQQPGRYVYFISPDKKKITPVITDYGQPNGIIGTPDAKKLYVADFGAGRGAMLGTWSYTINNDATLTDKKFFCPAGSDGMTIDDEGYVYTTRGGANGCKIWDKNGTLVQSLNVGSANICFAGKNNDILFINNNTAVYGIKMRTHGTGPN